MAKMTLDELVKQLRSAYGADLTAVVLYGSAAGGEHIAKRSDYNVLVIVKQLGLPALQAAGSVARAWSGAGNPPPLTFTDAEWRRSADIFPMEYADILERNRVLFGTPPFEGIAVRPEDLRLQLEREAMGTLLKLRQGLLGAGGDDKKLIELVAASLSTLMVVFRAFLRLHGDRPTGDNMMLVSNVAKMAEFDPAPFQRAVRHARGDQLLKPADAKTLVNGYVDGMESLVAYLDRYPVRS